MKYNTTSHPAGCSGRTCPLLLLPAKSRSERSEEPATEHMDALKIGIFAFSTCKILLAMTIEGRYKKVIEYFQTHMPVAETELAYSNPYELIASVILSAQCTDKRVNQITPSLFGKFPTVFDMAGAEPDEIFTSIRSCSYPNSKAKHLSAMARKVVKDFNGIIPESVEALMSLPGVGRKTANVVTLVAFGNPSMPVDTHVFRVAARIGLTTGAKNPAESENQLVRYFPKEVLAYAHHWLILHGRYICKARKPGCESCGLAAYCRHFQDNTGR